MLRRELIYSFPLSDFPISSVFLHPFCSMPLLGPRISIFIDSLLSSLIKVIRNLTDSFWGPLPFPLFTAVTIFLPRCVKLFVALSRTYPNKIEHPFWFLIALHLDCHSLLAGFTYLQCCPFIQSYTKSVSHPLKVVLIISLLLWTLQDLWVSAYVKSKLIMSHSLSNCPPLSS